MTALLPYLPWIPLLAALACGVCTFKPAWRSAAGPICVAGVVLSFLISLPLLGSIGQASAARVYLFPWIHAGAFAADFSYFIDPLTVLMLMVVTGIGALVAIYAMGYMKGDPGYARFFFGVSLFFFSMLVLVLADNLVLLYLGWEGVGLCSYLLIGFHTKRPSAVAAAKKAFIVNRIGDLGFALGIFLTYVTFDTVSIPQIADRARVMIEHGVSPTVAMQWIPFLLMLGAFGKSAQLPLYVWLPDAMEGPTPVSALIHAATMVTAGVYMIARLIPVFQLSEYALPTVAIVGAATALFAASIAMAQHDIKRVFAFSTVSQLGYMFLGVGVLETMGGVFHLFTHAFFKALLFLTAGSVMHAMAGQLDMRKMSGLKKCMPVTGWLMFIGCLALAGVPGLSGFFSKDTILAATLDKGLAEHRTLYVILAGVGLVTAAMTAYYTFRLWFRVFVGPTRFQMGQEHHEHETHKHEHGHDAANPPPSDAHTSGSPSASPHESHEPHEPHEMPWWPMNLPLAILALGAIVAGYLGPWVAGQIEASSAAPAIVSASAPGAHGPMHGGDHSEGGHGSHTLMLVLSSVLAAVGVAAAWYLHAANRGLADRLAARLQGLKRAAENQWYVDAAYTHVFRDGLRTLARIAWAIDEHLINGVALAIGYVPRVFGYAIRPFQRGGLQGYGLGMVGGIALIVLAVVVALMRN